MDYGLIAIKLSTGFIGLWLMTRLLGKKEISQLTPFDFVSSLMLSELVGNTIYAKDVHYLELLFAFVVWYALSYGFEVLGWRFRCLRDHLEGKASLLIENGRVNERELRKNKLDFDQLQMMLRQKDVFSIREVAFAVFETNGGLSVLRKSASEQVTRGDLNLPDQKPSLAVGLVEQGSIFHDELERIGRDTDWLFKRLAEQDVMDVKEVAYAEWKEGRGLYVLRKGPEPQPAAEPNNEFRRV
jgi:uncharacterized membrane protein YcaP (DUF421 family)